MSRGHDGHRHLGRVAALATSALIASANLFGAATSVALAVDSPVLAPAATVAPNGWTNAANALGSANNGTYATASGDNVDQGFANFGISVPAGSIVDGITVRVEAKSTDSSGCQLSVQLSGNNSASFTSRQTQNLTTTEQYLTFGGTNDAWGRVWDPFQMANGAFTLQVRNEDPGMSCNGTTSVDRLDVKVSYRSIAAGTANPALSADVCDTADFNFVVDMSGSIGAQGSTPSNLSQLKNGITDFVDAFQAAGGDGRYSGTRFNNESASALTSGYVSAASFNAQISALTGPTGATPTAAGIDTGAANNGGDRAGAPNILFVVTDGSPNVPGGALEDADTWLEAADAAIDAADDARAGSGASRFVVKAVYLSTAGDPGDTNLPFSAAGDAAWAQAVMTEIGGGSYLEADFKNFAKDLFEAIHCAPPPPTVEVTKTASPTSVGEPGGTVTFSVAVHNTALDPVTLDSLVDDVYGDLDGKGTCNTGGTIAGGGTYNCEFSGPVSGAPGSTHTDTVTADVSNQNGSATDDDDAVVTITDVLPTITVTKTAEPTSLLEPGGTATFSVSVLNTSPETVTLDSLVDDVYGDLDGKGSCDTGGTIAVGGTYSCEFSGPVAGNAGDVHVDTVTAEVSDNDGNSASDDDDASVAITDILPEISVIKSANPTQVAEPGGSVTFSVSVDNDGDEAVTLDSLVDDVYGDLNGKGTCDTGGTIAAGGTYSCQFSGPVAGDAGSSHTDTVTAGASDDDGNNTSDEDDAVVRVTDVLPRILVIKSAFPGSIGEPGGDVTFTVTVTNTSVEPVTLDSLVDDVYGDLDGVGTCDTGGTIAVGDTYTCEFVEHVTGNAGSEHVDTVVAEASDNEGNTDSDQDDASVAITDEPIGIAVNKSVEPTSMPEPGGMAAFTVSVANTGTDTMTLDSLVDDIFGDLDGRGTCEIPQVLSQGETYTCSFEAFAFGDVDEPHRDTVTGTGSDDDGNTVSDEDSATVEFTDVLPTVTVDKSATPATLPAAGGNATFSVIVTNTSIEPVTITSLVDDVYGDLNGQGTCAVGATLAPGGTYLCSFIGAVPGTAGNHVDIVTVTVEDNEENDATDNDDAVVSVDAPVPSSSPSGQVEGVEGTPSVTPPPTDVATAPSSSTSSTGFVLAMIAVIAFGATLFMTAPRRPSAAKRIRRS